MTGTDTEAHYRRYISSLNNHLVADLSAFVEDELTYNGKAMTRRDYENLLTGDIAAIPDLYFDIALLVVHGDRIACRLNFRCTPQREFLGLQPNGKTVSFSEHVFYRLHDGRICEVWSLIDRAFIEAQLAS